VDLIGIEPMTSSMPCPRFRSIFHRKRSREGAGQALTLTALRPDWHLFWSHEKTLSEHKYEFFKDLVTHSGLALGFRMEPFVSRSPNERLSTFTFVGMGTAPKSFRC
jgi:hypothetical protein